MMEIVLSLMVGLAVMAAFYGAIYFVVVAPDKVVMPIFIGMVTITICIAAYLIGAIILGYR